jgi:hypothetical protein
MSPRSIPNLRRDLPISVALLIMALVAVVHHCSRRLHRSDGSQIHLEGRCKATTQRIRERAREPAARMH